MYLEAKGEVKKGQADNRAFPFVLHKVTKAFPGQQQPKRPPAAAYSIRLVQKGTKRRLMPFIHWCVREIEIICKAPDGCAESES